MCTVLCKQVGEGALVGMQMARCIVERAFLPGEHTDGGQQWEIRGLHERSGVPFGACRPTWGLHGWTQTQSLKVAESSPVANAFFFLQQIATLTLSLSFI